MKFYRSAFIALTIASAVFILLSFLSCSKDNGKDDVYRETAKDALTADYVFADVMNQVDLATRQLENDIFATGGMKSSKDGGCATITIFPFDTLNWPKTITIYFGDVNCEGIDGKYRRGTISGIITGLYNDSLTVITIHPDNYYVNDYKVDGTKTVTNLGHDTNGDLSYSVRIQNGIVTKHNGKQFSWDSEFTRTWTEGEATAWPAILDDVFEISGEASGTLQNGTDFVIQTSIPLRIERDCEWIVSGQYNLTPLGYSTRTLHYGDGNCDDKATLTGDGISFGVTLP